ncbi:18693_t:CDS:2 [Acaulospora morrowiae]|uniref:18693_t:CDS:1 n=1 Tax=Acaulospora morrowiae TaxID=94023 RepID=A0A9N9E6T7_9GLOM|nr:18693_t:CDS:2 [Acaulospora morrowiae]
MHKLRRLRRRVTQVDIHSEDEDESEVTREELDLSDLSGSEASCEDSDIESENSHSEGEEEIAKEQLNSSTEALSSTKGTSTITAEETKSLPEEKGSLIEDTTTNVTEKKGTPIVSNSSKLPDKDEQDKISDPTKEVIRNENSSTVESHSGAENEKHTEDPDASKETPKVLMGWQKKLLARQEYRKKLAEDPAFVPHLGEFWGHDDRFTKDELKNDFDPRPRNMQFGPKGRAVWGNSPPKGRWGHDGFEELMRLDEEERRHKEFQRRVQQRRNYGYMADRRRSPVRKNSQPSRVEQNRPSNFSSGRKKFYKEQSVEFGSKKSFATRFQDKNNGEEGKHTRDIGSSTRENNTKNEVEGNDTSRQKLHKNTSDVRSRGYSKNPLRPHMNRVHANYSHGHGAGDGEKNLDDANHHKTVEVKSEPKQDDIQEADAVKQHVIAKNEDAGIGEAASTIVISGEADVKDVASENGVNLGLSINEHEGVTEDSDEESEVEIILDPPSSSTIGKQESSNEPPSEKKSAEHQEKERSQTTTASKRYSTRRVATITVQNTQTSETERNDSTSKTTVTTATENTDTTTAKKSEIPLSGLS